MKWEIMAPYWNFLKRVYYTWHLMKGSADGDDGDHGDGIRDAPAREEPERGAGSRKHPEHVRLISDLKDMQKRRHVCEIVWDILSDHRVKTYAWMSLGCCTYFVLASAVKK